MDSKTKEKIFNDQQKRDLEKHESYQELKGEENLKKYSVSFIYEEPTARGGRELFKPKSQKVYHKDKIIKGKSFKDVRDKIRREYGYSVSQINIVEVV